MVRARFSSCGEISYKERGTSQLTRQKLFFRSSRLANEANRRSTDATALPALSEEYKYKKSGNPMTNGGKLNLGHDDRRVGFTGYEGWKRPVVNDGGGYAMAEEASEPALNTDGGWERPSRAGWRMPLEKCIQQPRAAGVGGRGGTEVRWKQPASSVVIDSREAVLKYGGRFI